MIRSNAVVGFRQAGKSALGALEVTGLGGGRGGNTERVLKNGFGAIPYFLEIADVREAYLIFEIISVLPKVCSGDGDANMGPAVTEGTSCRGSSPSTWRERIN